MKITQLGLILTHSPGKTHFLKLSCFQSLTLRMQLLQIMLFQNAGILLKSTVNTRFHYKEVVGHYFSNRRKLSINAKNPVTEVHDTFYAPPMLVYFTLKL